MLLPEPYTLVPLFYPTYLSHLWVHHLHVYASSGMCGIASAIDTISSSVGRLFVIVLPCSAPKACSSARFPNQTPGSAGTFCHQCQVSCGEDRPHISAMTSSCQKLLCDASYILVSGLFENFLSQRPLSIGISKCPCGSLSRNQAAAYSSQ